MQLYLYSMELCFERENLKSLYYNGEGIELKQDETISFDTYFNSFSCSMYRKNTLIDNLVIRISVSGSGQARLMHISHSGIKSVLDECSFQNVCKHGYELVCKGEDFPDEGLIYLEFIGGEDGCSLHSGEYYSDVSDDICYTPKIGMVICTYKREEFVLRNVEQLRDVIGDKAEIFIVDNGNSLSGKIKEDDRVHLFSNPNYGGSAGFTRGIIEVLKRKDFSHVWLMDDDIEIDVGIIDRVYSFLRFLKPEERDLHIASGMIPIENPTVQYEATATYDGLTFRSNKSGLDLTSTRSLLMNEEDCKVDYAGWWSLVIPVSEIGLDNLPLPLFIKLDDAEYGVRNIKKCITLNGFGVWHKSFGSKTNSYLEYYTTRNSLIVAALHYSGKGVFFKIPLIRYVKSVALNEPKCLDASLQGVRDFLKGATFLKDTNAEKLNSEVMSNYGKSIELSDEGRGQMKKKALKNLFSITAFSGLFKLFYMWILLLLRGNLAKKDYKKQFNNLTSFKFWKKYLGI